MKRALSLAVLLSLAGLIACSNVGSDPGNATDGAAADAPSADGAPIDGAPKPAVRILFIGNSYTSVNDLPAVVAALGDSELSPVTFSVAQHAPGGAKWSDHDANPAVDELIAQGWDYVVLQDQSKQPWFTLTPAGVKPELVSLDSKIKAAGAKTLLFMTWARSAEIVEPHERFRMNMAVVNYYERHAAAVNAEVAPVGRVWERALRDANTSLFAADGSHPNERGTYLTACVFYTALTGLSPVGLGDGGLNIPEGERTRLQQVAWQSHLARQPASPPLVGRWPLSAVMDGPDLLPADSLDLGDVAGPDGASGGGTTFATFKYVAVPYFPGLNTAHVTVSVYAHRDDWSVPVGIYGETLVGKRLGYRIWQYQDTLATELLTVGEQAIQTALPLRYVVTGLAPGWHHLALTYDGTTYALWVDAEQVASGNTDGALAYEYTGTATINQRYNGVAIGGGVVDSVQSVETGDNPFNPSFTGALSDLRLFDRALTAPEIQALVVAP